MIDGNFTWNIAALNHRFKDFLDHNIFRTSCEVRMIAFWDFKVTLSLNEAAEKQDS